MPETGGFDRPGNEPEANDGRSLSRLLDIQLVTRVFMGVLNIEQSVSVFNTTAGVSGKDDSASQYQY